MEKRRELRVYVPKELYDTFKEKCHKDYKLISEKIRDLMLTYIRND